MSWIILVGANSDMAKAAAGNFARRGYNLCLLTRNPQKLNYLTSYLSQSYKVKVIARYFEIEHFLKFKHCWDDLKPFPVGIIYFIGYLGEDSLNISCSEIEKVYNLNCIYAVKMFNYFSLKFIDLNRGSLIAVSSVSGERGKSMHYLYNSAKSALSIYLQGLRLKLMDRKIKVVDIRPGFVKTKFTKFYGIKAKMAVSPEYTGEKIFQAYKSNRGIVYIPWWWRWLMLAVKLTPERLLGWITLK
ncbi:MAG: SDR family NAD(P)-dependent oxidoreductase [bacterium]